MNMAGTYFGKVCEKHPGFAGERRINNRSCTECNRAYKRVWGKNRVCRTDNGFSARMTRIKQATPPWADKSKIRAIYEEARKLGLTVDHDIPLRGKLVSGLHVENNLRILTQSENDSKGNRFDME